MYTAATKSFVKSNTLILFLIITLCLITIILIIPGRRAAAEFHSTSQYTISSVLIEEGDSLWSIASDYYSKEFSSMDAYIKEIKRMNRLSSNTIYTGNYILVPHYTERP